MTAVADRYEPYVTAFDAFRGSAAFGGEALRHEREAALRRFLDRGFPTTREEEWRFTNVAPIANTQFTLAAAGGVDPDDIQPFALPGACQIVVVNGRVSRSLSALEALPGGVTVHTLQEGAQPSSALLAEPRPGAVSKSGVRAASSPVPGPFADLNEAFFEDVVAIRVAPGAVVETPVHVLAFAAADSKPALVSPRLFVLVGEGAQLSLVESYAGTGPCLTSAVTEIVLEPGAVVDHVKIQRESPVAFHIASLVVRLGRASTFTSRSVTFGGRISRNDITAILDGEGAECTLNGLYICGGDALVDTHTTIDHAKPHCPSHEVYKGILAGRARAVFNGKIIVRPDAQKTDAKQTNKALLLTDTAQVNTKPQLEIFADDVKCTHGAAIGQLDEDAMFYLRARGIDEASARNLLIHAFAGEILEGIRIPGVRERLEHAMEDKLRDVHAVVSSDVV